MKLQDLRIKSGITQSELAARAGINLSTYRGYEIGKRSIDNAHIDTLINISNVLNVPFYELMDNPRKIADIKQNLKNKSEG